MNEFFNCIVSKNGLAYLTGFIIFAITLFLTSKKIIGFTLTLIFLIFAIIAATLIHNQDVIRGYFVHPSEQPREGIYQGSSQAGQRKDESSDINTNLQKAFDDLKKEVLEEKERLQKMWEDFHSKKEHEEKNPPQREQQERQR